jgi:putative ABC transport system substrate-binding protein
VRRREFVASASAVIVTPCIAAARPVPTVRLGVLSALTFEATIPFAAAFRDGLGALGYAEGENVQIQWRYADGRAERFARLADELVRLKVDLIVAGNHPAVVAAHRATSRIPIVMVLALEPADVGIVTLAHPGGNVTGFSSQVQELVTKRMQLLREALPQASRLAIIWDPAFTGAQSMLRETQSAAQALGLHVELFEARTSSDFDAAFAAMARHGTHGTLVLGSSMQYVHRARLATLALKSHLPSVCVLREYVDAGCLMSYAPSLRELWRGAAVYVDKIIRGAKPGDLPIEQPTTFELVINLKTAKALGVTIPASLLARADQVIE